MNYLEVVNSFNTTVFHLANVHVSKYSKPTQVACRLAETYRGRVRGLDLPTWVDGRSGGLIGCIIIRRDDVSIREGEIPYFDKVKGIVTVGMDNIPIRGGQVVASAPDLIMVHYPGYPVTVILYTGQLGRFSGGFRS